jgi:hypothetical protein
VTAQFLKHPLPHHRAFGRVMEDVDLPESKKDFALQGFLIFRFHWEVSMYYDYRNRLP